jgi:hypothetical protein
MDQCARAEIIKRINDFATTGSFRGLHRLRFGKKRVIIRLPADSAEIVAVDNRDKIYK